MNTSFKKISRAASPEEAAILKSIFKRLILLWTFATAWIIAACIMLTMWCEWIIKKIFQRDLNDWFLFAAVWIICTLVQMYSPSAKYSKYIPVDVVTVFGIATLYIWIYNL